MASEPVEMHGRTIAAGDQVYLIQAAANRDPDVFHSADSLILDRHPNRHCGFGFGIHYCLGAPIARLEGAIAIRALVESLNGLRATPSGEVWHPTLISRGMSSFLVEWDA